MARFDNKNDLREAAESTYKKLTDLIDTLSIEEQETPFSFDASNEKEAHWSRDENLRDVLIHVYEWQELLISWVKSNENGNQKPFLPEKYSWKSYGEMNVEFFNKHRNTPLNKAKELLHDSYMEEMKLLDSIADAKLFAKGTYAGGSTIGQYFISTTVGHYDWAIKKLKKHIKEIC